MGTFCSTLQGDEVVQPMHQEYVESEASEYFQSDIEESIESEIEPLEHKKIEIKKDNLKDVKLVSQTNLKIELENEEFETIISPAIEIEKVFSGNINIKVKNKAKIVRIFTSSTFTDTKYERNTLMEKTYPKLKGFCQSLGYKFQVVDMRWGVRGETADDHGITDLCLKEIRRCKELSTGPFFVTFLSHKYGYRPFPKKIDHKEFHKITSNLSEVDQQLIDRWFKKDENIVPPAYVLKRISTILPDYISNDEKKQKAASSEWWASFERMQIILSNGAKTYLNSTEKVLPYIVSVTEKELYEGIINLNSAEVESSCLWFKRKFNGIEDASFSNTLSKYFDGHKNTFSEHENDANVLLSNLSEYKLPQKLPPKNIIKFEIDWSENGIDTNLSEHQKYISELCDLFEDELKKFIKRGIEKRECNEIKNPIYDEVVQHMLFCRSKVKSYHGRKDILETIGNYLKGNSVHPLIISGESGSGKTSLFAVGIKKSLLHVPSGVTIYRFLGTTPMSSSLRPLLVSLISQIHCMFDKTPPCDIDSMELKYIVELFDQSIRFSQNSGKILIIFLDSLDQLDAVDGGRQLHWLPKNIPITTRLVLSTIGDSIYQCFDRLLILYPKNPNILKLTQITKKDSEMIVLKWLKLDSRRLTELQHAALLLAFQKYCPLPLFLKLSYDETLGWHSFDPPSQTQLQINITDMIVNFFCKLEKKHGYMLVRHALGYICASDGGLSELEIEDLLSLSDHVLNDVYQFWTPPMRRLPPLLWVRLKTDMEEYLVNRGMDGIEIIYWYHRQFIETATKRYLGNDTLIVYSHQLLAEYFNGTWAETPKPYQSKKGEKLSALRYVDKQPYVYDNGDFNVRKIMQLPYHLILSNNINNLKLDALCNYQFLLTKLKAKSLPYILSDLRMARKKWPKDKDLQIIMETLLLSQDALIVYPNQLAGQLIGRIESSGYLSSRHSLIKDAENTMSDNNDDDDSPLNKMLNTLVTKTKSKFGIRDKLLEDIHSSKESVLLPHRGFLTPPGGRLVYKISGHKLLVNDMIVTKDRKVALTVSNDASLKSWDLETGELLLSFESSYPIKYICLNPDNNETAIISMEGNKIMVVNYHYGTIVREMTTSILAFSAYVIGIGQDYPNYLVGFYHDRIDLYDIKSGLLLKSKPSGMVLNWPEQHIGNCLLKAHGTNAFIAAKTYPYVICIDIKSLSEMWKIDISEGPKQSHVTSLSIGGRWINGEESIVFCNGMNNNISIRSIKNGSDLKTFKGCSDDSIELIETLEDLPAIYYENYKTVGFIDLKDESREPILPHPCQIRKIVAIGENLILTLSEDNIIRLWDRSLDTFSPDMSAFTGKYTLPPGISVDFLQNLMVQICPDIANDDGAMPDIKKFFTNSNMVKYWIRSDGTNYEGTSYMFIKFNNSNEFASRYLITTQNIVTNDLNVDICCTIWDLSKLTAVRRIFISPEYSFTTKCTFGETLIIMTSCTKKCIVAVDSIEVKVKNSLRNIEYIYNSKFIPFSSFNCIAYQKTKSIISFISPEMQIIGEFDIGQYDDKIHQIEKDKHENVLFVLSAETYNVYILNPSTLQQIKKISAFKYLNKTSMTVELVYQDTCYLLLCDHSAGSKFINIDLNPEHAMIYPSYDVTLMTSNDIDYYILLLYYEKENSVSILSTKAIGKNFNCMKKFIGENCIYAVIWSSDGYERTFYYLKTSDDKHSIDHIASFTLDNEIDDVYIYDDGGSILIDSPTGIVRLAMEGSSIKQHVSTFSQDIIFTESQLNQDIQYDE